MFQLVDIARFTLNAVKLPNSGYISVSIDGGQPLAYRSEMNSEGCINYGPINVSNPAGTHWMRVALPTQVGVDVAFELLGAE